MTSGKLGGSFKRNCVLSFYPLNAPWSLLPCIAQMYNGVGMLTKKTHEVPLICEFAAPWYIFLNRNKPAWDCGMACKTQCFGLSSFWFACGFSQGRQRSCWEMCPDFEPAFSLAHFQSCSSGRAVSLQITEAVSSVQLGEEYANLKIQNVMHVSALMLLKRRIPIGYNCRLEMYIHWAGGRAVKHGSWILLWAAAHMQ